MGPELVETVDRWARGRLRAADVDRAGAIPPRLLGELAEMGLFGLSIPEAWGGLGLSLAEVCDVVGALARHDRSVATTVGLHLGLGTRGMVAFGSDEMRARWLPDIASGRHIAAFATTEPEAGSDLAAIRTRATPSLGGLRVEGEKVFVTNGGFADVFTITASTPGLGGARRGHSLLVLGRGDAGVRVGPEEHKLGLRGSSTTSLALDADVPLDRVIGAPGEGMAMLAHVLAWGRTVMAAGCVGTATAALDRARAHTSERRQFGKTLDQLEIVRGQLAGMAAVRAAMDALVRAAATAEDGALAARSTAAKVFCSEGSWEVVDLAVQLHGGSGFIEETGLPLLLRDARITRIFEGANDVLRLHLGLMEATRPVRGEPTGDPDADALAGAVAAVRAELLDRHGVRLLSRHAELHRLGALVVLREATDAAARAPGPASNLWRAMARRRAAPLLAEPVPAALLEALS